MNNIFLHTLRLKRFPIDAAVKSYNSILSLNDAGIQQVAEEKKWEIFNHHFKHNPFYKNWVMEHHGSKLVQNWESVPLMPKSLLKKTVSEVISAPFNQKNNYWGKTSGSSGSPLVYVKDKFCHAMTWAKILSSYRQHHLEYGKSFQARFYGMPLEFPHYQTERLKDMLSNRYRFVIHDLSASVLDKYIDIFRAKKFDYVYGYTNSLLLFANHLKNQEIVLSSVCPTLKKGIVTSEMCSETDRLFLSTWFGVPVINEYGASELDLIAFDDPHGNWKLNRETLFVEILDDENRPLPPGQTGRIIVSSLYNRAMPFIRYELGDRGAVSADGKILEKLEGRTNDLVKLQSGKIVPAFTLYYTTKALMHEIDGFLEYKIIQPRIDTIEYFIVCRRPLTESQKQKIKNITWNYLEPDLNVLIHEVAQIERSGRGKLKHFESMI